LEPWPGVQGKAPRSKSFKGKVGKRSYLVVISFAKGVANIKTARDGRKGYDVLKGDPMEDNSSTRNPQL